MLLNRVERALMNNPVRAAIQRHYEARRLYRMGGPAKGGAVLEVGCGRGVGVELIADVFGAGRVEAFDLDVDMVRLARQRLGRRGRAAHLWVSDAAAIPAPDARYGAVFDFGIIHHVPDWRAALREIARVLKPGGRLYGEEVLRGFVDLRITRWLLEHPRHDRFDAAELRAGLGLAGFTLVAFEELWRGFAWFVADKAAVSGVSRHRGESTSPGAVHSQPKAE